MTWRTVAFILLIILILETAVLIWAWNLGTEMLEQENNDPREIVVTKAHIHAIEQEQKTRGISPNTLPKGIFQPLTTETKDFKETVESAA